MSCFGSAEPRKCSNLIHFELSRCFFFGPLVENTVWQGSFLGEDELVGVGGTFLRHLDQKIALGRWAYGKSLKSCQFQTILAFLMPFGCQYCLRGSLLEGWVNKSKYPGNVFGLTVMLDHLALDTQQHRVNKTNVKFNDNIFINKKK